MKLSYYNIIMMIILFLFVIILGKSLFLYKLYKHVKIINDCLCSSFNFVLFFE